MSNVIRSFHVSSSVVRLMFAVGAVATGVFAAGTVFAQSGGVSAEPGATARREAAAAAIEAKRGNLSDKGQDYKANAQQRCARLPADLKTDCESRARGEGSTSGSVQGGGILRQTTTTTTVPADRSTPATTTAPVVRDLQPLPTDSTAPAAPAVRP